MTDHAHKIAFPAGGQAMPVMPGYLYADTPHEKNRYWSRLPLRLPHVFDR